MMFCNVLFDVLVKIVGVRLSWKEWFLECFRGIIE